MFQRNQDKGGNSNIVNHKGVGAMKQNCNIPGVGRLEID